jgi:hypothetical protein
MILGNSFVIIIAAWENNFFLCVNEKLWKFPMADWKNFHWEFPLLSAFLSLERSDSVVMEIFVDCYDKKRLPEIILVVMRCFMVIAIIVERIKDPRNTQSLILLSDDVECTLSISNPSVWDRIAFS